MKRLLLAVTALGLAGTIGTANAAPDISSSVDIWGAATTSSDGSLISADPAQQALPSAIAALMSEGGTSFFHTGPSLYTASINYSLPGSGGSTIPAFFASNGGPVLASPVTPSGCTTSVGPNNVNCQTASLSGSAPGYTNATLMEFVFTTNTPETFTVQHDDGVSLFHTGMENGCNQASCPNDLLPLGDSAPTKKQMSGPITLSAGTYDLWYTAANSLPELLQTDTEPVPAPLIGHGLLVLLAVSGVLFGGKLLEGVKTRHSHAA
jgi:hypothetical protein